MKGLLVFVKLEGHILNILSASKTYIDDPVSYAKTFEDLLIQSAFLDHAAWLSVTTCQAALLW
jgi:hypothetical protein